MMKDVSTIKTTNGGWGEREFGFLFSENRIRMSR
jgi:hypothetical protein